MEKESLSVNHVSALQCPSPMQVDDWGNKIALLSVNISFLQMRLYAMMKANCTMLGSNGRKNT